MYAAKGKYNFLTIATHPGALTSSDLLANLVLLEIMSEQEQRGELDAEEALAQREAMSPQELNRRMEAASSDLYDPEWQQMWQRLNLDPTTGRTHQGKEISLEPIEKESLVEMLEDLFLQKFWEPMQEWDHSGPSA